MPPKMTARKPTPKQPMPCALGRESSALTFLRRVLDVLSGFTCSSWQTNHQSLSQTSHPCVQVDQPSVSQLDQPSVCLGRPTISLLARPATRAFRQTNHQSLSQTSHPCVQVDRSSECLGRPATGVFSQISQQCLQVDQLSAVSLWQINQQCLRKSVQYTDTDPPSGDIQTSHQCICGQD